MALDDDIRVLSGVDLFAELGAEELRLLAFGAETVRIRAGQQIYREGDTATCAFVIKSGRMVLYRNFDGVSQSLSRLDAGAILGEMALITPTTRLTHAGAETEAQLLRLNRSLFRRILEEYPESAARLHRNMVANLHAFLKSIERIGPKFSE